MPARARNTGSMLQRRYIAFLDADDVWMVNNWKGAYFFKKRCCLCVYDYIRDERTYEKLLLSACVNQSRGSFKTVFLRPRYFLDTEKGRNLIVCRGESEDSNWWKILRSGFVAYGLNEVLAVYRRPAKSLSSNKLEAVKRIWNLYRREEKLSLLQSVYNLFFWALRATIRRL